MVASHENAGPNWGDLAEHDEKIFITYTIVGTEIIGIISCEIDNIRLVGHFQQIIERIIQPIIDICLLFKVSPIT